MTDDVLFEDDGLRVDAAVLAAVDARTDGQRLRDRQAARIGVGMHPLALHRAIIRLHPDAPHDARPGDARTYPRCGTCRFRQLVGGHARDFPKCLFGDGARAARSVATDVRAWWPACTDYTPREEA